MLTDATNMLTNTQKYMFSDLTKRLLEPEHARFLSADSLVLSARMIILLQGTSLICS
jgi:hypothetical protein